jgi:hypothetical protein
LQVLFAGVSVPLGTVPGVGRVSFSHNQITNGNEILVNNGTSGYIYNTVTQVFQRITDTSYPGGLRAVFINNRFVQIEPARRYLFNSALADGLSYTALDRFTSETSPDLAMGIESIGNQLAVFSSTTTEWFEDTGANPQPFRSTGIVADKGAAGPFSTAKMDNQLFMLADDGVFYRYQGYNPVRISTKPIEQAIRNKNWFNVFTTVWEDSGYAVCYWTFPDGHTWGYDASSGKWHRRESYGFNRWRLNSLTYWQNAWYGGDFQNGRLWQLDWDYLLEGDQEFESIRAAGVISDNQNRVIHERLEVIMDTGMVETVPVDFVDQPEGPTLSGTAPDGETSEEYSFTYTATPGDAPIARTVLMPGSYVMVGETQYTIPGQGWSWNQNTATISNSTIPLGVATVNLVLRTYDTNGLFADHTDTFNVVQLQYLLITGVAKGSGQPIFAYSRALEPLEFTGITQVSGADLASASAAWDGEKFCAVSSLGSRTSDALAGPWVTGTLTPANSIGPVVGLADGWVAVRQEELTSSVYTSPTDGSAFILPGVTSTLSNGDPGDASSSSILFELEDQYYLCRGALNRAVYRSTDRDGPYVALWDIYKEIAAGRDPNGAHISYWYDIKKFGDEYFAIIGWHFDDAFQRFKIIKSPTLTNWDTFDVVVDVARDDVANRPAQLCAGDTAIVAYTTQGKIWTSANDWEEPIDTGLVQTAGSNFNAVALFGGKRIVQGSNLFYMIGNEDKVVVFNPATLAVSAPVTMPIDDAVSISISSVEAP